MFVGSPQGNLGGVEQTSVMLHTHTHLKFTSMHGYTGCGCALAQIRLNFVMRQTNVT